MSAGHGHGTHWTVRDGEKVPTILVDGVPRLLASIPGLPGARVLPGWSEANPVLPRAEWRMINLDDPDVGVLDQGQHSSCTGQAAVGALMRMRALAGLPHVDLSPTYPYTFCNNGRDAGAMIGDVVRTLVTEGTCPVGYCPQDVVYASQVTPEARSRAVYRVQDAYQATSFDDIGSGLTLGWCVVFALQVGATWSPPNCLDRDGCPPIYRGPGNHAMHGVGLDFSEYRGWLVLGVNSWGERWGRRGQYYATEGHFEATMYQDAYLIRLPAFAPEDPIGPVVVLPGDVPGGAV